MKQHTAIRLDPEPLKKLEALAKLQDRSVAYLIRKAIEEFLERQTEPLEKQGKE
jgi:predicted transcriptional regulator